MIIISLAVVTVQIYSIEEENIKTTVIKNQIQIQEIITKSVSRNTTSELKSIIFELSVLSEFDELQNDLGTQESNLLIQQAFNRTNSISPTAQIPAIDENFVVLSQAGKNHTSFVGAAVRVLSVDEGKVTHFFEGDYVVKIFKVTNTPSDDLDSA